MTQKVHQVGQLFGWAMPLFRVQKSKMANKAQTKWPSYGQKTHALIWNNRYF